MAGVKTEIHKIETAVTAGTHAQYAQLKLLLEQGINNLQNTVRQWGTNKSSTPAMFVGSPKSAKDIAALNAAEEAFKPLNEVLAHSHAPTHAPAAPVVTQTAPTARPR